MKKSFAHFLSIVFISCIASLNANAADRFVSFKKTSAEQMLLSQGTDTITYDANEWEGVKIAVRNLRNDLMAVTGNSHANIIVKTLQAPIKGGMSAVKFLENYGISAKQYKQYAKQLKGKWEQYLIINNPAPSAFCPSTKARGRDGERPILSKST